MLNLDTHILLYALQGQVSRRERETLSKDSWGISTIVPWEITKLHQRGRISVSLDSAPMVRALAGVEIWPITPEVCLNLKALDFQSDPADEIIAATSLTLGVPLMTRDAGIRASKLIEVI